MVVIKRDGREEEFNADRIRIAVSKAFAEVDGGKLSRNGKRIANKIASYVGKLPKKRMSVEEIQDIVEMKLMESNRKDVAKAYILYRDERTKSRNMNNKLIQTVLKRIKSPKESDVRSNANVDEKSFSGREKEVSSSVGKALAIDYDGLSQEVADAHKEALIYQHDLEKAVYGIHNCLNLNFQEVFTYGFRTRNGDVRPPNSFSTACQLYAVAFQCQSQVQFGGVGSIHADIDLAPFVKLSFYKHYGVGCKYVGKIDAVSTDKIINYAKTNQLSIDDPYFKSYPEVYEYAMNMLEIEGSQSAEGLFHNLNTLESRQGSQVPFVSINLGRDTTVEGRKVTKWIMKASINGIGKHHLTSIFPISIFQYKKGTNANPGDKNYDLKLLALDSMSKRIYPNWCNCDWSQAHEDENNPDTFFATMGKRKLQLI